MGETTRTSTQQTAEPEDEMDERLATAIALQLWDEYWDEIKDYGEDGRKPLKMFAKLYQVPEKSPIALMFQAFTGGITKGLLLGKTLFDGGAEESQP